MVTSGCGDFLRRLLIFSCLVCFSSMKHGELHCNITPDDIFRGLEVDCISLGLEPRDIPTLNIPVKKTTSLILDNNRLQYIINESFTKLQNLRRLEINECGISRLEIDAFKGLVMLEILSLYGNLLDISNYAFPFGVFSHTPRLKKLNIGNNYIRASSGNYSTFTDIFQSLKELSYLYISSFETLYIGKEFENLAQLERLDVHGASLSIVLNNSLEGLEYSKLKHFKLTHAYPYEFETGLFKSLPRTLSSLTLTTVSVGNLKVLSALEPLGGRNLSNLVVDGISLPVIVNPIITIEDGIFDSVHIKYMMDICVINLTWKNSGVMAIDLVYFPNSSFKSCLRYIDISGNNLQNYRLNFLTLFSSLKFLEEFRLSHDGLPEHTISFWDQSQESFLNISSHQNREKPEFQTVAFSVSLSKEEKRNYLLSSLGSPSVSCNDGTHEKDTGCLLQETRPNQRNTLRGVDFRPLRNYSNHLTSSFNLNDLSLTKPRLTYRNNEESSLNLYLPPHLNYASFDTIIGLNSLGAYLKFVVPNNLTELYVRYASTAYVPPRVRGLTKLRLLDYTGTMVRQCPLDVFDFFPSLQVLVLRHTQEDPNFFQTHGRRIFQNIANLVYLDLADNGLRVLPEGIFQENRRLRYLCLAKNRFSTIPFQIRLTPSLEMLDLRMNAFSGLEREQQENIDEHIITTKRVNNFTLFLEGNNLQCMCSNFLFTAWMQRTRAHFDMNGLLSCMAENGKAEKIEFFSDMEQMWRKCQGQYFLLLSVLLLFAMLVLYLAVFLLSMYRTFIIGKLKQIFVADFHHQTRQDFTYDVFIVYAAEECRFVRFRLLRYLEDVLKLKTFVHQRDLRQDLLDLGSALKDSWRTLLIITESFLAHDMSENIMKTATFFESPSKQDPIIIMVTEDLLYAIPDYVLRVVKDENIIVLPDLETPFSYEATETLRTRILC